ncbi:NeuD/PglB/VioB family sugar acetyltransferase [Bradyrhizobium lablabi]|uniref:NeuD/PglB/VioB family sugar acetyltransferase n=1 Tax=Bradyrhizobium lablabi TaxID=722472 RepID=UPI001BAC009E|nr:NeuD/PglB/VioB family sugar acetyltransferase [Bradyrhizobium lablabi]MBR0693275.1 NeuD/PglB/VioB family sugar acetyltransferase [Bradyrhizobium lablabi]
MKRDSGLVILGFGGHARSVAAVAIANGVQSLLFVDENARDDDSFLGFAARRELSAGIPAGWSCVPGVGDNTKRKEQVECLQSAGWELAKVISSTATIDANATVSPGSFVGHHAHLGPLARIGLGCIINTGAIVEHESQVGDFSHVSVNSVVAGRSQLGRFVFLGAGATVIDGVSVGDNITIGAGAAVVESLSAPGTYIGCPARRLPAGAHPSSISNAVS